MCARTNDRLTDSHTKHTYTGAHHHPGNISRRQPGQPLPLHRPHRHHQQRVQGRRARATGHCSQRHTAAAQHQDFHCARGGCCNCCCYQRVGHTAQHFYRAGDGKPLAAGPARGRPDEAGTDGLELRELEGCVFGCGCWCCVICVGVWLGGGYHHDGDDDGHTVRYTQTQNNTHYTQHTKHSTNDK